jgi:SOS-response transcriptional repressor LexA
MLTRRQQECLDTIAKLTRKNHGVPPNYKELQRAMGYTSVAPVQQLLDQLERANKITRTKGIARSIRLVGHPKIWEFDPEKYPDCDSTYRDTLKAIVDLTNQNGAPPSTREVMRHLGISIGSYSHRMETLRDLGLITWDRGFPRTLRLLDRPIDPSHRKQSA